ncbi:hypothetical protein PS723_05927 [Pseudomonas fluorescens]|uniref:RHS repeat-associated core domain-containing protein n=1 Tax=Pseudomonas fluorescens TaxID=294 RepID=A0A5E7FQ70_PSEFL|nr:hypothetical protein PS723_05927 [Pseudomonas fluorescens]
MPSSREIVLCRYRYDPLDLLASTTPLSVVELQRFYCKSRLATEIQGQVKYSIFQHDDQLLAQQQSGGDAVKTTLLATDQQRSVLHAFNASPPQPIAYSPYGHRPADNGLLSLLGFNGERRDPVTGHYLLGNGYRAFNPVLMRFNSPDSWSPFGDGGLNSYAYCFGDPVNRSDPNGHTPFWDIYIRFAASAAITRRVSVGSQVVSSIDLGRLSISTPSIAPPRIPNALGTITMPFTNNRRGENFRRQTPHRFGSTDSLNSNGSFQSTHSSVSARLSESTSSINWFGPTSSTDTASTSSGRGSISVDSNWSGSGRRANVEWGSNESLSSVSSYPSGSAPRGTFVDTLLTLDAQGNVSSRPDLVSTQTSRIRGTSSRYL